MRLLVSALSAVALTVTVAHAQTVSDFSNLRLKVGEFIYVADRTSGVEVSGPVKTLSPSRLAIDGYVFEPRSSLTIDRRGDSLLNGTLIGLGIGAVAGPTIGAEACLHSPKWHCVVAGAVTYGAIGALIDWLHKGRTRIYPKHSW